MLPPIPPQAPSGVWWSWGSPAGSSGPGGTWLGRACGDLTNSSDAALMALPSGEFTQVVTTGREGAGAAVSSGGDLYVWGDGRTTPSGATLRPFETKFGQQFGWNAPTPGFPVGTPPNVCPPTRLTYSQATNVVEAALTVAATFWRRSDGTVWGVGRSINGEFGTGEAVNTYHATPVQLTGLPSIQRLFAWENGVGLFALDTSNRLWFAGNNTWAMDGGGFSTGNRLSWLQVAGLGSTHVVELWLTNRLVGASNLGACAVALASDGTVWTWGRSMVGTASTSLFAPSALSGVSNIKQMYASYPASQGGAIFMLDNTGQLLGLGRDSNLALTGLGDRYALPPWSLNIGGKNLQRLMTGSYGTVAMFTLSTDAQLWGWGFTDYLFGTGAGAPPINSTVMPRVVYPATFNGLAVDVVLLGELGIFTKQFVAPVVSGANQVSIVG